MNDAGRAQEQDGEARGPWWKRPAVIAAATAVVVTAGAGWIQQGGIAVVQRMLQGDRNPPRVAVSLDRQLPTERAVVDEGCRFFLFPGHPSSARAQLTDAVDGVDGLEARYRSGRKVLSEAGAAGETGPGLISVTVTGQGDHAVVLKSLEVEIVKKVKKPPVTNLTLVDAGTSCGGGFDARYYEADLDRRHPEFRIVDTRKGSSEPTPFPYRVTQSEPEQFYLSGLSDQYYVEWFAKLTWSSNGKSGEAEISNSGQPFTNFGGALPSYEFHVDTLAFTRFG